MMGIGTMNGLLILFCVLAEAGAELCFKQAANAVDIAVALRRPILWLGIVLWAVELVAWVAVLRTVPLTVAFPLMALVYVVTQLGGVALLKEPLSRRHGMGALLITAGVALIGSTGV